MKVSIDTKPFLAALDRVRAVVCQSGANPVMSHVLVDASEGRVAMRAVNAEVEMTRRVHARVVEPGVVLVPPDALFRAVGKTKRAARAMLAAEPGQGSLVVDSGGARYRIPMLPPDDYPRAEIIEPVAEFGIPLPMMRFMAERVSHAISDDETRYYLRGVHLHATGEGKLAFVATDGHKLSRVSMDLPEGAAAMPPVIIPRAGVAELDGFLADAREDVAVEATEKIINFSTRDCVLSILAVDGTYPDYEKIIPKGGKHRARMDAGKLAMAARNAVGGDGGVVVLEFEDGILHVSAKPEKETGDPEIDMQDIGPGGEKMAIEGDGGKITIAFKAAHLVEILATIDGDAEFVLDGSMEPGIILEAGNDAVDHVIMYSRD